MYSSILRAVLEYLCAIVMHVNQRLVLVGLKVLAALNYCADQCGHNLVYIMITPLVSNNNS